MRVESIALIVRLIENTKKYNWYVSDLNSNGTRDLLLTDIDHKVLFCLEEFIVGNIQCLNSLDFHVICDGESFFLMDEIFSGEHEYFQVKEPCLDIADKIALSPVHDELYREQQLAQALVDTSLDIDEVGYDLSEVGQSDQLEEFFHFFSIYNCHRDEKKVAYVWESYHHNLLEVRTGAHPFANGLLFDVSQGTRGQGYCSYIGIKGNKIFVDLFKELMSLYGSCKGYSKTPEYI